MKRQSAGHWSDQGEVVRECEAGEGSRVRLSAERECLASRGPEEVSIEWARAWAGCERMNRWADGQVDISLRRLT